jgi:hypothetical protein
METLNKETQPSILVETKSLTTDAEIYGAEVPQYVLVERQREQEFLEQNVSRHAENIVYATEIVNFADDLLEGNDSFSHSETTLKNGVNKFNFGSFDIKRTSAVEGEQDYSISMIKMGFNRPQRVDYSIAVRDGHMRVMTHNENSPQGKYDKPQNLNVDINWSTEEVMDAHNFVKSAGERAASYDFANTLQFMEYYSEKERAEQEKLRAKAARKRGNGALHHLLQH